MRKIVELLNKYEAKLEEMDRIRWREENGILYRRFMSVEDAERMVISKSFGFIERLVHNDKINKACLFFNTADLPDDNVSKLLMLLAISDNPIEDLISYLK